MNYSKDDDKKVIEIFSSNSVHSKSDRLAAIERTRQKLAQTKNFQNKDGDTHDPDTNN